MASIPTMPPPKINFSRFGYIGKKPLYAVDTPENLGTAVAKFKCTFEDFKNIYIENNNNENSKAMIEKQLKNRVKKCPKCLKSCGETMVQCNGCGHDIRQIECSYTPNVFTLFICSVEKFNSNRPLSISLRYESEEFIVMDDLNAMSLCHMLIVPTNFYVPDVRHLYKHPKEGLKLVNRMVSLGIKIFQTQFLSKNDEIKKYFYEGSTTTMTTAATTTTSSSSANFSEQFRKHFVCCFNLPPSQFQLHLQFIFLPFVEPDRWNCNTSHFMPGRCFVLEYVLDTLTKFSELNISIDNAPKLNSEEMICEIYEKTNISYEKYIRDKYNSMYDVFENSSFYNNNIELDQMYRYKLMHTTTSDEKVIDIKTNQVVKNLSKEEISAEIRKDKFFLSNFGRRSSDNNNNNDDDRTRNCYLNYYSYGKEPPLKIWCGE